MLNDTICLMTNQMENRSWVLCCAYLGAQSGRDHIKQVSKQFFPLIFLPQPSALFLALSQKPRLCTAASFLYSQKHLLFLN